MKTCAWVGNGHETNINVTKIDWQWVKGHNGHPENERVDQIARDVIRELT